MSLLSLKTILRHIKLPLFACILMLLSLAAKATEPATAYEEHLIYQKEDTPSILECYHFAIAWNLAVRDCAGLARSFKWTEEQTKKCERNKAGSWMDIKGYKANSALRDDQTCIDVRPSEEILKTREKIATDAEIAFAWESRAPRKYRSKQKTLLGIISKEYREAKNEFERNDIEKPLVAKLKSDLRKAKSKKEIVVTTDVRLGEYDFDRKGYPLKSWNIMQQGAIIHMIESLDPSYQHYHIEFTNPAKASFVKARQAAAKKITSILEKNKRKAELVLHCKIIRARAHQPPLSFKRYRQLKVKIKKAELNIVEKDYTGRLLFVSEIK